MKVKIDKRCTICGDRKPADEFYAKGSRCKPCAKAVAKAAYERDRQRGRDNAKRWAINNVERRREIERKYRAAHYEERRAYWREFYRQHPEKYRADWALWRARQKTQACQHEDCAQQIKTFYSMRPKGCEVDHVIPLARGGLHCIQNLQFLTKAMNRQKGARL